MTDTQPFEPTAAPTPQIDLGLPTLAQQGAPQEGARAAAQADAQAAISAALAAPVAPAAEPAAPAAEAAAPPTPTLRDTLAPAPALTLPKAAPSPEAPVAIGAVVQPETGSHIEPPQTTAEYAEVAKLFEARRLQDIALAEARVAAAKAELEIYMSEQDEADPAAA